VVAITIKKSGDNVCDSQGIAAPTQKMPYIPDKCEWDEGKHAR